MKYKTVKREGNFDQDFVKIPQKSWRKWSAQVSFQTAQWRSPTMRRKINFWKAERLCSYNGSWGVANLDEDSPLAGHLTVTNWPTAEGGAEKQNSYIGGASATFNGFFSNQNKKKKP